jgi:RNA polymerase sigma-54 factor
MSFQLVFQPKLTVTARQVLCSRVLQLAGAELPELLRREMEQNPALEARVVPPQRDASGWAGAPRQRPTASGPVPAGSIEQVRERPSPRAALEAQIGLLAKDDERDVAVYLLHCLDEHGYLKRELAELAAELETTPERVEQALRTLQQLEPPGIGARDLRECLLLQCDHLGDASSAGATTRRIVAEAWDDVAGQRWGAVARRLHLSQAELRAARAFIRQRLYPYPLFLVPDDRQEAGTFRQVDLVICRERAAGAGTYTLELPGESAVSLQISASFAAARHAREALSSGERAWIDEHVQRARLLIHAVAQRWQTLRRIGEFLIENQQNFLDRGPLYLKPLTRADLAGALALHPSTVGRAVRDKVVQLPDGRLTLLKDFFDDSLPAKAAIRRLVAQATEPLSDEAVAQQLAGQGIRLARRTVTKYRRQLGIPAAHARYQSNFEPG